MSQKGFTDLEYSGLKRKTKREEFLDAMENIIPWGEWEDLISPHYFSSKRGRPLRRIKVMLRMYLVQAWFSLSDEGVEDAIYDSYAIRKFVGIDFLSEQAPDATTLLHFRHMIEKKALRQNRIIKAGHVLCLSFKYKYFIEKTPLILREMSSMVEFNPSIRPEFNPTRKKFNISLLAFLMPLANLSNGFNCSSLPW